MGKNSAHFEIECPPDHRESPDNRSCWASDSLAEATLDGRERRKLFVSATLSSSATSAELAKASMIMIDAQAE